jgi:hypothetical protein
VDLVAALTKQSSSRKLFSLCELSHKWGLKPYSCTQCKIFDFIVGVLALSHPVQVLARPPREALPIYCPDCQSRRRGAEHEVNAKCL